MAQINFRPYLLACVGVLLLAGSRLHAQGCGAMGGDNRPESPYCAAAVDDEPGSPRGEAGNSATRESIDLVTGNKYLRETDAQWPGGLRFSRHYNARHAFALSLGPGWSHTWDTRAALVSEHELQVIQADGRRRVFRRVPAEPASLPQDAFESHDSLAGRITRVDGSALIALRWQLPDGQELQFDPRGRLHSLRAANTGQLTLHYDPRSQRLVQVRNSQGVALRLAYDDRGRLSSLIHPDGRQTRYRYDDHDLLTEVIDPDNRRRRYGYSSGPIPQALERIHDHTDRQVARFEYDTQGRATLSRVDGRPGIRVHYRLPASRRASGLTEVLTDDGSQSSYRWQYRVHDHVAQLIEARGAGCPVCPPTGVSRRFDARGRLRAEIWHQTGFSWHWERDRIGRIERITRRPLAPGPGAVPLEMRRFEYFGPGLHAPLLAVHVPSLAPGRTASIAWRYDASGRVIARTLRGFTPRLDDWGPAGEPRSWLPIERAVHYGYHEAGAAAGRLAYADGPLPGPSDRTGYHYDAVGRLRRVELPEGLSEEYRWDASGRLINWRDIDGVATQLTYGPNGHPTRIDRAGQVAQWEDRPAGERWATRHGVSPLGVHVDATGGIDALIYADGQRASAGVPGGHTTSSPLQLAPPSLPARADPAAGASLLRQWRNDLGDLVAQWSDLGGLILHRHDEAGRIVASQHESGAFERHAWDALGRPLSKGDAANPVRVVWRWQGSRLLSVSDPVQTIHHQYDVEGRPVMQATLIGDRDSQPIEPARAMVVAWRRDSAGRVTGQSLPGGHALGLSLDERGRVRAIVFRSAEGQEVVLASGLVWTQAPSGPERLTAWQSGHGLRVSQLFDEAGRSRSLEASLALAPLARWRLERDANGRITAIDSDDGVAGFAYDQQGRLTGLADAAGAQGIAFDLADRRAVRVIRSSSGPWRIERYHHDPAGRLLMLANAAEQARWLSAHSPRGEIGVEFNGKPERADPTWAQAAWRGVVRGPHAREIAAFAQRRVLALYDHDVRGLRVRRTLAESAALPISYLHHQGQRVGEADAQGRLRRWYVRIGGWPLAELRFDAGRFTGVRWWVTDHRGLPIRSVDETGRVRWAARAEAFGSAGPTTGGLDTEDPQLRLPGQWLDAETGHHENGWRSYRPALGRYAQPDPLAPLTGGDPRAYAGHDPIGRVDPFGLYEIDVHYYLTYFLARVAGVSPQRAFMVATAAQYIDDDPMTRPETPGNLRARDLYHFVMVGHDRVADATTRYFDPNSPQLRNLLDAARQPRIAECAQVVLFGEFLHTFEDAFSHRDENNVPFGYRGGHLMAGHDPDQTYDVVNSLAPANSVLRQFVDYRWNGERSLRMAQETFLMLGRFFGTSPVASFETVSDTVQRFLQTGANEHRALIERAMAPESDAAYQARKRREVADKIAVLDAQLQRLGSGSFGASYADGQGGLYQATYDPRQGQAQRARYLAALRHGPDPRTDPFRGVLLPGD